MYALSWKLIDYYYCYELIIILSLFENTHPVYVCAARQNQTIASFRKPI